MENFHSEIKNSYGRKEMSKLNELIGSNFRLYFLGKNYVSHDPAPLISQEDKTVIFTGSSVNVIKPKIISGNYPQENGFIITQECLRNHALEYAFKDNWLPFGQAYFNMSTILSKPGRFSEVVAEASEHMTNSLGIDPSQITIKSTKTFSKLEDIDKYTDLKVEYNTRHKEYYQWTYGIPKIRGEGATISIMNPARGEYLDVGAIVQLLDEQNNERGIEFGYGHEFLLSVMLGLKNPLELSQIFEIFPFNSDLSSKYYGYLEVIARIKKSKNNNNIRVNKSAKCTYNKYLKSAKCMAQSLGKDTNILFSELSRFCEHISSPSDFTLEQRMLEEFTP